MTDSKLQIIFAGSGEFGVPTLSALAESGHQIVQVVTQPDRPAGRGRSFAPTPVALHALAEGLPLLRTADINAESLPVADLMVVIAFGQKIAARLVDHPRLGSINLHASVLPKFRGAAPINWAILAGETESGNSVIRLAPKMDAGAVLGQSRVAIDPIETAGELHDRLSLDGVKLVLEVVSALARGESTETVQDESLATIAPKLSRRSAVLDFSKPAEVVARTIRGLHPWPGCRARLLDAEGTEISRLRLVRAVPIPGEGARWEPGEVTAAGHIECGADAIDLLELQPDGGKAMGMADYRRGHQWQAGLRLEGVE
ncbi:MAG TPA: methionyl-tRNA formyltransferase [Tepidisphaeraceae bacterium]|jgi:methionyl-tRNA formyltransferase